MPASNPSNRTAAVVLAVIATLIVLTGCSTREQPTSPPPSATSAESATLTPELDHLHALHIRADGTILAGTHTGVIALTADGTTSRVGVSDDEIVRLSSPIGLDLGARTPEETAVSIAAEIISLRWGGAGSRLSERAGPIHHAHG